MYAVKVLDANTSKLRALARLGQYPKDLSPHSADSGRWSQPLRNLPAGRNCVHENRQDVSANGNGSRPTDLYVRGQLGLCAQPGWGGGVSPAPLT